MTAPSSFFGSASAGSLRVCTPGMCCRRTRRRSAPLRRQASHAAPPAQIEHCPDAQPLDTFTASAHASPTRRAGSVGVSHDVSAGGGMRGRMGAGSTRCSCHCVPQYAPAAMRADRPLWMDNFKSWGTAAQRPTAAAVLRRTAPKPVSAPPPGAHHGGGSTRDGGSARGGGGSPGREPYAYPPRSAHLCGPPAPQLLVPHTHADAVRGMCRGHGSSGGGHAPVVHLQRASAGCVSTPDSARQPSPKGLRRPRSATCAPRVSNSRRLMRACTLQPCGLGVCSPHVVVRSRVRRDPLHRCWLLTVGPDRAGMCRARLT